MERSIFLGMLKVEPPFLWGVELEAPILGVLARCQMVSSRVSVFLTLTMIGRSMQIKSPLGFLWDIHGLDPSGVAIAAAFVSRSEA